MRCPRTRLGAALRRAHVPGPLGRSQDHIILMRKRPGSCLHLPLTPAPRPTGSAFGPLGPYGHPGEAALEAQRSPTIHELAGGRAGIGAQRLQLRGGPPRSCRGRDSERCTGAWGLGRKWGRGGWPGPEDQRQDTRLHGPDPSPSCHRDVPWPAHSSPETQGRLWSGGGGRLAPGPIRPMKLCGLALPRHWGRVH